MELLKTHRALFATLILTILYALHYGIPLYVTSSFLKDSGFSSSGVSLIYGFSSLLTLLLSNHISKYIKKYHTYAFTFSVVLLEIITTTAFASVKNILLVGILFILHFILNAILFVLLNIFVESFTPKKQTGLVRGIFLTLYNSSILISPLIGGLVLETSSYLSLYITSSLILIPYFFFLHHYLKENKEPAFENHSLFEAGIKVFKSKDLRAAIASQFALYSFYIIMVIYTPLYITQMLHISLSTYLLVVAPITLLPLVILPYELGYLADQKYGEKEFMIVGLSLLGITSFFLGIIHTKSILFVIIILFFSRVGAALVETMNYTYYYKKISKTDPAMTNFFTNINAFASFVVPSFLFLLSPLIKNNESLIFTLLSLGIFSTIHSVMLMKDTK